MVKIASSPSRQGELGERLGKIVGDKIGRSVQWILVDYKLVEQAIDGRRTFCSSRKLLRQVCVQLPEELAITRADRGFSGPILSVLPKHSPLVQLSFRGKSISERR